MRTPLVIAVVLCTSLGALCAQELIFEDDFESGDTSAWYPHPLVCQEFFGGTSRGTSCYTWYYDMGDWNEAQATCAAWAPGASLVSVASDPDEWQYVKESVIPLEENSWIGLGRGIDGNCPGSWLWDSGELLDFEDWEPGQPDDPGCPVCAAAWDYLDHRWDDMLCSESGVVDGFACEYDMSHVRVVGPDGGEFRYPGGVVLDIPAETVDQETPIGVYPVDCADVDPILDTRPHTSHEKRCIGAIDLLPHDLELNESIVVTLPVEPREPREIAALIEIVMAEYDYKYHSTTIEYDAAVGAARLTFPNTLGMFTVAALDPGESTREDLDPDDPCRSGDQLIVSDTEDLSVLHGDVECQMLVGETRVTFYDCPGAPTEDPPLGEVIGCPDMDLTAYVCDESVSAQDCYGGTSTPPVEMGICDTKNLKAWMEAREPGGGAFLFYSDITFFVFEWQSTYPSCAGFDQKTSRTLTSKETLCSNKSIFALNRFTDPGNGTFSVALGSDLLAIEAQGGNVDPDFPSIDVDETITLVADPVDAMCTDSAETEWEPISGGPYVLLNPESGELTGETWTLGCPDDSCVATVRANQICSCDGNPKNGINLTSTIDVVVLEPDIVVDARFLGCEWDADYCYVPELVTNPTTVEIRAGQRMRGGEMDWKGGVDLSLDGNVIPSSGTTNSNGMFLAEGTTVLPYQPFSWVDIDASYKNGKEDTSVWAVTDDICHQFRNPPPIAPPDLDSHGTLLAEAQIVEGCQVASSSISIIPSVGSIAGSALTSAQASIEPSCGVTVHQLGFWWDTVLVIPKNLRILDTMWGVQTRIVFGVSSTYSGSAEGDSSATGSFSTDCNWYSGASQIAHAQYSTGAPTIEWSNPTVTIERWLNSVAYPYFGMDLYSNATSRWDYSNPDPLLTGDAEINGSTTITGIENVLVRNPATQEFESLNNHGGYWVFSCSGEFTQGQP